jgi:hypothetical protein
LITARVRHLVFVIAQFGVAALWTIGAIIVGLIGLAIAVCISAQNNTRVL